MYREPPRLWVGGHYLDGTIVNEGTDRFFWKNCYWRPLDLDRTGGVSV